NPTLEALHVLGGSGTIQEIYSKVTELIGLSEDQLEVLHDPEKGSQTEIEYRLAWTRTYLKKYGLIDNSIRGVWALTQEGRKTERVDPDAVRRFVMDQLKKEKAAAKDSELGDPEESDAEPSWREILLETLLDMSPDAFERLAQRVLRESGFTQVEVTGRSGDDGIDGKGIMRLGGLLSFQVIFQCKRYRGPVSADKIRDFRGAMIGRADKGLVITTGNFTKDAVREATRDGAPTIDLVDGDSLVDKLKELGLGVSAKLVQLEEVEIDRDWFATL
ncbi:MAG: restriction endonuclease, partial [Chloroflexota bacterium]|nr:restriction endonuclease [Chloroflexota bacterium]